MFGKHYSKMNFAFTMDLETIAENEWNEKWFQVMSKIKNVCWVELSYNENTPIAVILNHPEIPWSWRNVSNNPQLTMQIVLNNLDKKWCWTLITMNSNITSNDILQNIDLTWNWSMVVECKKITIEIILAKPNHPWNWKDIHVSECISLKTMLKYQQFPWYYKQVQFSHDIHLKHILHGKIPPITLRYSSFVPLNFVAKTLNYDWQFLSSINALPNFEYDKLIFIERQTMLTLLITFFDFYQQPDVRNSQIPFSNIERIFLDEYLMQLIAKN